jgi:hypothetical protein
MRIGIKTGMFLPNKYADHDATAKPGPQAISTIELSLIRCAQIKSSEK